MTSKLSNAVSHVSSWSLDVFLHPYKDWRFLLNFKRKSDIFANSMEYQKIMNIDNYVTFDLGWLYTWLSRRWKASNLQFSKNFFWVPFGVPRLAVKSHLYALLKYFLFENWNWNIFGYHYGTQKICVAKFEIKAFKRHISHVSIKSWQDLTTFWSLMFCLGFNAVSYTHLTLPTNSRV